MIAKSDASTGKLLIFLIRKIIDKKDVYVWKVKTSFGFVPKRKMVKCLFLLVTWEWYASARGSWTTCGAWKCDCNHSSSNLEGQISGENLVQLKTLKAWAVISFGEVLQKQYRNIGGVYWDDSKENVVVLCLWNSRGNEALISKMSNTYLAGLVILFFFTNHLITHIWWCSEIGNMLLL